MEKVKAPKDQPIEFLPLGWRIYLSKVNITITTLFMSIEKCHTAIFDT